jgi:HPr kinase/phosphorylase
MSETVNLHANAVMLAKAAPVPAGMYDMGILILGDSGSGKSDLTLRLIEQGALLVADDRTELFVEDGKLKARAPAALAGLIEIRGIGIVALPYEKTAQIGLVVQLAARTTIPRLPGPALYTPPPPLALPEPARPPLILLDPFERSAAAKLRWAAYAHTQGAFRTAGNTP